MSHGHNHGQQHGHRPMVGQLSRGQFAKIVFPCAILVKIFIAYSILYHIYGLNLDTKELPIDGVLFCILWILLVASFLRGSFTSPGSVEKGWYKRYPKMHENLKMRYNIYKQQMKQQQQWMTRFNKNKNNNKNKNVNEQESTANPDADANEETKLLIQEEEKEENDEVFPDNFARPPRSHYCFELESNVLRMDHFCVWFNNAVGFYNYKYFLLTIVYLLITCLLSIYILIYRLFINTFNKNIEYGILNGICIGLTLIICIFFTVFSAMHTSMHVWQMSKNLTSIEMHKYNQIKAMCNHFKIEFVHTHEFDNGKFSNCKKMLGYDIWFWIIPTAPSLPDDGYKFYINQENKTKIESVTKSIQAERERLWKASKLNNKFIKS